MGKSNRPRRGSLQFWPRKRAKSQAPAIRHWPETTLKLAGFAGYKAGMLHAVVKGSERWKKQNIAVPVTIVETPPLFIYAIKLYKKTAYGLKSLGEFDSQKFPKELKRAHTPNKKTKDLKKIEKLLPQVADVRVLVCTQPSVAGVGKKTPELFEVGVGGKDVGEKLSNAKEMLGKSISVSEIFKAGDFVDVVSVTKGKGWQGVVKRFGVPLNPHKATQARRHGGPIGTFGYAKVEYSTPRAGQMGYHIRWSKNNPILLVSNNLKLITPPSGFRNYGLVKSDFLVIKGSIPGPVKRLVKFRVSAKKHGEVVLEKIVL